MKLSLVFTLLPIIVSGFRAPENGHMNVKLPDIKKASPQKAALIAPKPPKEETANIVDAKTPDSVLAQQLRAVTYKRWGIDNENDLEYWNDSRIHTLGNIGFWGAVHAIMAPLSTKMIDVVAYNGTDVRYLVSTFQAFCLLSSVIIASCLFRSVSISPYPFIQSAFFDP